jgi:hypothetical protein
MEIVEILLFGAMAQVIAEAIDVLWPETGGGRPQRASMRLASGATRNKPAMQTANPAGPTTR